MQSQNTLKPDAVSAKPSPRVPSPDAVNAASEMQEDLRQLRAELSDVKSKFAETQAPPSVLCVAKQRVQTAKSRVLKGQKRTLLICAKDISFQHICISNPYVRVICITTIKCIYIRVVEYTSAVHFIDKINERPTLLQKRISLQEQGVCSLRCHVGLCLLQAALAETQQQVVAQKQHQTGLPTRSCSPEGLDSVSPQKLRALQETMQDLHAEVAELRAIVHQKNAELDTMHRCGHAHTKRGYSQVL